MKHISILQLLIGLFSILIFSACEAPPTDSKQFIAWFNSIITGKPMVVDRATPTPSPSVVIEEDPIAKAAAKARDNSQILKEMMLVVYMQEPKDRAEFGNWADTLNQGASLEGVYNGFTHSKEYHQLELTGSGASPIALRIFGEELAQLELELPVPTQFDSKTGEPITQSNTEVNPNSQVDVNALANQYSKQFVGTSIFTLKRVISDEALKVIFSKNAFLEKLAIWYSKWVVRLAQRNVDFGVPLRNKADERFHYKWATENDADRIKWEVLNRLHRLLNDANKRQ